MEDYSWIKKYIDNICSCKDESTANTLLSEIQTHIKKPLYKYCFLSENNTPNKSTIDHTINNFENDLVYFSSPKYFNDPYDCLFGFDRKDWANNFKNALIANNFYTNGIEKAMEIFLSDESPQITNYDFEILMKAYNTTASHAHKTGTYISLKDIQVSCFSERMDSALMWSHYANKHYGFCLGYDFSMPIDSPSLNSLCAQLLLLPVIYSKRRPFLPNSINTVKGFNDTDTGNLNDRLFASLHKSNEWSYEKEWRILKYIDNSPTIKMPKPIELYLGLNIEEHPKQRLLEIASIKRVPVFQMYPSMDKYNFDFLRIQ